MKRGLHKNVASIFDGVEIPGKPDDDEQLNGALAGQNDAAAEQSGPMPSDAADSSATIAEQTDDSADSQSPQTQTDSSTSLQHQLHDVGDSHQKQVPFSIDEYQANLEEKTAELEERSSLSGLKDVAEKPRQNILEGLKKRLFGSEEGAALKKRIITAALVPTLAIALMVVLAQNLSPSVKKIAKTTAVEAESSIFAAKTKIDWQIPAVYPTTLRDPMQFGAYQTGGGNLIVKGILYSDDKPAAVIDNEVVHIGDVVFSATIVKINPDSVEFEKDGNKWTQKVQP